MRWMAVAVICSAWLSINRIKFVDSTIVASVLTLPRTDTLYLSGWPLSEQIAPGGASGRRL
jgi:hypothetical protein